MAKLDAACARVEDAGETDFALRYARARLRHEAGRLDDASDDWDFLRALAEGGLVKVHDWERTLVWVLSAATEFARNRTETAEALLEKGEAMRIKVLDAHFPRGTEPHPDLDAWADVIADLRDNGAEAELPELDFVTLE